MGFGDIFLGIVTGGAYNAVKAAAGGYSNQSSNTVKRPKQVDYSQALMYMSDNDKITNLAQVHAGVFELQQADADREMQAAAKLEQGLETLDTNLQVSKLDYIQRMTAEENRHIEAIAEAGSHLKQLQHTFSTNPGLPPPPSDSQNEDPLSF